MKFLNKIHPGDVRHAGQKGQEGFFFCLFVFFVCFCTLFMYMFVYTFVYPFLKNILFMYIVCYAKMHCVVRAELSSKPVVFLTR